jgi:hypothetical protein
MVASLLLRTGKAAAKPTWPSHDLVAPAHAQDLRFRARVLLKDAKSRMPEALSVFSAGGEKRLCPVAPPAARPRFLVSWERAATATGQTAGRNTRKTRT